MIVQPPVRMAGNFMPSLHQRLRDRGILLKRLTDGVARNGHAVGFKEVEHAPDSDTGAIFVVALYIEGSFALPAGSVACLLVETAFARSIAVLDRSFGTLETVSAELLTGGLSVGQRAYFFIIDHKAHRDLCATWPLGIGRSSAVSDKIAREVKLGFGIGIGIGGVELGYCWWCGHLDRSTKYGISSNRNNTNRGSGRRQPLKSSMGEYCMMSRCSGQSWPWMLRYLSLRRGNGKGLSNIELDS